LHNQLGVCVLFGIYTAIGFYLAGWRIVKSEINLLMITLLGVLAIFEWWVVRNKNYRVFPCLVQQGSCGLHFREF
jgi:hypothetical protein